MGKFLSVAAAAVGTLAVAPLAVAQSNPAESVYAGQGNVPAQVAAASAGQTTLGNLPFTGLDIGLFLFAGVALIIVGFVLRRTRRPKSRLS